MLLMFSLESQTRVCSSPSSVGVGPDIRGFDNHTTLSIPSSLVECYTFDHARCLFFGVRITPYVCNVLEPVEMLFPACNILRECDVSKPCR